MEKLLPMVDDVTLSIVTQLYNAIPCTNGQLLMQSLKDRNIDPTFVLDFNSPSASDFRDEYLFSELLSKYEDFGVTLDKTGVALRSFIVQEAENRTTNLRLAADRPHSGYSRFEDNICSVVRRVIGGRLTSSVLKYCLSSGYYGPGANVSIPKRKSHLLGKVRSKMTVTEQLLPFALSLLNEDQFLSRTAIEADGACSVLNYMFSITPSSVITVPKNAKTDRVITIEPSLNSYFQNGVGRLLRQRLLRVGVDLRKQSRNQDMASRAVTEGYATVDLKQASNSLTTGCVRSLLRTSPGWFQLLNTLRSQTYTLPNETEVRTFEMFSGMGNGFTFGLESMIFYAIAKAICENHGDMRPVYVYGDDILLPQEYMGELIAWLSFYGFSVNTKKTHYDSLFRESCGGHYLNGQPVKPFYIRRKPNNEQWYYTVHNALLRWATQDGWTADSRVKPVLRLIREMQRGPIVHPVLGDVGYHPFKSINRTRWETRVAVKPRLRYKSCLTVDPLDWFGGTNWWCALKTSLDQVGTDCKPTKGLYSKRGSSGEFRTRKQTFIAYDCPFFWV